ncbi:hypothetical protein CYMTET_18319 [Cymbomonas tetramitiformis]|uniref:Histone H3-K79 methyltransferase n=1 Tax=Cymbomonas tetramitiformis TaxID=36881 RepID=A0AAE0L6D3_9CHLO|nr:hypothetical protein CYMTET_18319 [Cymbomonas tetramitiformis]
MNCAYDLYLQLTVFAQGTFGDQSRPKSHSVDAVTTEAAHNEVKEPSASSEPEDEDVRRRRRIKERLAKSKPTLLEQSDAAHNSDKPPSKADILRRLEEMYEDHQPAVFRKVAVVAIERQDKIGDLIYGEVSFLALATALQKHVGSCRSGGTVFYDLGSGAGRSVFGAAMLCPAFTKVCGIELLEGEPPRWLGSGHLYLSSAPGSRHPLPQLCSWLRHPLPQLRSWLPSPSTSALLLAPVTLYLSSAPHPLPQLCSWLPSSSTSALLLAPMFPRRKLVEVLTE